MVRPVLNPGRLLEPVSDCWPRWMTVHDRTRLIGQLQLLRKPRFGGVFAICAKRDEWLSTPLSMKERGLSVSFNFLENPASAGFLLNEVCTQRHPATPQTTPILIFATLSTFHYFNHSLPLCCLIPIVITKFTAKKSWILSMINLLWMLTGWSRMFSYLICIFWN